MWKWRGSFVMCFDIEVNWDLFIHMAVISNNVPSMCVRQQMFQNKSCVF